MKFTAHQLDLIEDAINARREALTVIAAGNRNETLKPFINAEYHDYSRLAERILSARNSTLNA